MVLEVLSIWQLLTIMANKKINSHNIKDNNNNIQYMCSRIIVEPADDTILVVQKSRNYE
jgi:hypothetical protein